MIEDYTAWRFWLDIAQVVITGAIAVYVWWDRRKKVNNTRFTALEKAVTAHHRSIEDLEKAEQDRKDDCKDHKQRTATLEVDVRNLPSRQDVTDLSNKIGSLTEKLGTLDGRLTGINRAVDLLNQHHLRVD